MWKFKFILVNLLILLFLMNKENLLGVILVYF